MWVTPTKEVHMAVTKKLTPYLSAKIDPPCNSCDMEMELA